MKQQQLCYMSANYFNGERKKYAILLTEIIYATIWLLFLPIKTSNLQYSSLIEQQSLIKQAAIK